jgi:hypothetical protein
MIDRSRLPAALAGEIVPRYRSENIGANLTRDEKPMKKSG